MDISEKFKVEKKEYLLQNDVDSARVIFNDFLTLYPYCYDYWKKFAEMERRNGNRAEAVEVGF